MGGQPAVPEPPSPTETSRANYQQQAKWMPKIIEKDYRARMEWEPKYVENWIQESGDMLPDYMRLQRDQADLAMDNTRSLAPEQYRTQRIQNRFNNRLQIDQNRLDLKAANKALPGAAKFDNRAAQKYQKLNVTNTRNQLELEKRFGDDFAKAYRNKLQAMDPKAFALREQMGGKISEDLAAGTSLTDDEAREVEQAVRAGQTARGGGRGNSAVFEEAMTRGSRGRELYQNRLANAAAYSGNVVADQNQITRPQAQAWAPSMGSPFQNAFARGGGVIPGGGGMAMGGGGGGGGAPNFMSMAPSGGLQFYQPPQGISAGENFQNQLAYSQAKNRPNPYLKAGVGMASGALSGAMAGATMGSAVPGWGTLIGGVVGAGVGLAGGMM